jgi:hypothetical protein
MEARCSGRTRAEQTVTWAPISVALVPVVAGLSGVDLPVATAAPHDLLLADPIHAGGVCAEPISLADHGLTLALAGAADVPHRAWVAVIALHGVHLVSAATLIGARVCRAGVVVVAHIDGRLPGAHTILAMVVAGARLGVIAGIGVVR